MSVHVTLSDAIRRANGDAPRQTETRLTDWAEVMRRIRAAVAQEVPTDRRGDARSDCAQDLALKLWREAQTETGGKSDAPRRERVRMAYLRLEARSWARAARRDREDSATDDLPTLAEVDLHGRAGETAITDWGHGRALHGARALCELLNLSSGGPVQSALYSFLRHGASGDELAADLGLTGEAYRQAVSRGRALIRAAYPDPSALLAALLLLDSAEAGAAKTASKRTRQALKNYRRDSWRGAADAIPCDVVTRSRRGAPVTSARRTEQARRAAETGELQTATEARRAAILADVIRADA